MTNLDHIIPDLRPLSVPLDDLKLDPANARAGHALDRIAASLHRYGQRKPIVVNRSEGNKIEAGNGTWQAAKSLGWTHIAAVFVEDDPMTAVGYGIADNRLGDMSEWDAETLQALVAGLDPEMNLPTGFDDNELEAMLAELAAGLGDEGGAGEEADAEPQVSRAEELREKWGVGPGQMWRLPSRTPGQEHRLICGDCTDGDVVARVMGGEKAVGCVTSPPYALQRKNEYGGVDESDYLNWFEDVQQIIASNTEKDGSFFLNIKPHSEGGFRSLYVFDLVAEMCRTWQWGLIDEYCWKSQGTPGEWHNKFKNAFEPIYHFAKTDKVRFYPEQVLIEPKSDLKKLETYGGDGSKWKSTHGSSYNGHGVKSAKYGDKVLPSNVIEAASASVVGQSAAYPESIPSFFFGAFSCAGDVWLEMFCGSGTDLIAAENLARQCRAVEISPGYVAVALQRYADAFNITPELITEETAVS